MARATPLLALMLACGCGGYKWQGTWEGSRNFKGGDPSVARSVSKVVITLKEGGKLEMTNLSLPMEGEYDTSGKAATLKITGAMGTKLPRPEVYVLEAKDANTAVLKPREGSEMEAVTLKRAQP